MFAKIKKRRVILVGIIILFVIGIVFALVINSKNSGYEMEMVSRSDITEMITETGTIKKKEMTEVYSPSTGIIEAVYRNNGDTVTKGDRLFTVQSTATQQEQAEALSTYLTAKTALEAAQSASYSLQSAMFTAWDRYKTLAESDEYQHSNKTPRLDKREKPEFIVAQKNWLAAESAYKNQQSVIAQAQAKNQAAYLAYQSTQHATIYAVTDGVIHNISVGQGSSIVAPTTLVTPDPLAVIVGDSTVEASVSLTENDIVKIKENQRVIVKAKPLKDKEFRGKVSRLDTVGKSIQGVIRYTVYIALENPDESLLSGMKADIQIVTAENNNVLSVSNGAIKPYKGGKAVRTLDDNKEIQYVPIKIGIRGREKTEIVEGVTEGQEIILSLSNEQLKRPGLLGN